ncbi:MAG: hypothetical protein FJY97_06715 [candidate division Zixibacteria bacterium]|nr:hypothetical protein [candidate division Zixibacteria bacterium]
MSQPVCQYLRTKAYYTAGKNASTLTEAAPGRQFWCIRSMRPLGPDDRLVGPNDCTSQRPCFDTVDVVFA